MFEVLSSDQFWLGVIVGAVVLGWLAALALGSYKKTLWLKAQPPNQTPEKLGDKFYYLVDESRYNELLGYQLYLYGQNPEMDAAGEPKLQPSVLEQQAIGTINSIKAWADSSGQNQLPVELQMELDLVLGLAGMRRKGMR